MAPAIIQALPLLLQLGKSVHQGVQANKLAKIEDPGFAIPEADKAALNTAKYAASIDMPGLQQGKEMLDRNMASTATSIKRFTDSPSKALAALTAAGNNKNRSINELAIQASQFRGNALSNLQGAQNRMGIRENQKNEWTRGNYLAAKASESALREASYRNMMNTAMGASSLAANQLNNMSAISNDSAKRKIATESISEGVKSKGVEFDTSISQDLPSNLPSQIEFIMQSLASQDKGYQRGLGTEINL